MKIEQMIEVLNHFKNGGTIEQRLLKFPSQESDWKENSLPTWDFCVYEYRIKKEPKRVPYTYDDAGELIGKAFKIKSETRMYLISCVTKGLVFSSDHASFSFENFLKKCTHLDGSPCGKFV